ncbi:hypothetical protein [Sphingomonas sp. 10B4]|uniref:hypothetical protein n=1 Tax=Sphingomonas sp. 10B4 TaxID=3048575 RepID=UPI002AB4084B|nr:hypothetical protein [Sphingomonas sp. 10B4]MDY7525864.1 hypothetical protein [Sphingomonas sp. 10B4]MEB0284396.1 hypothetical protein [Sphingomonas sp. 10B4]
MAKATREPASDKQPPDALPVIAPAERRAPAGLLPKGEHGNIKATAREGVSDGRVMADIMVAPFARHAEVIDSFGGKLYGDSGRPPIMETMNALTEEADKAARGELTLSSQILTSQALALDAVFTDLARRAGGNVGPDAMERYMRLALKAQSNCRTTLEALSKLHQPREQTVRHVHVNEGGQAVIAENFHHHAAGSEYVDSANQPLEPRSASRQGPALLGTQPSGQPLPGSSDEGKEAVQAPRREKHGRTKRK